MNNIKVKSRQELRSARVDGGIRQEHEQSHAAGGNTRSVFGFFLSFKISYFPGFFSLVDSPPILGFFIKSFSILGSLDIWIFLNSYFSNLIFLSVQFLPLFGFYLYQISSISYSWIVYFLSWRLSYLNVLYSKCYLFYTLVLSKVDEVIRCFPSWSGKRQLIFEHVLWSMFEKGNLKI